MHHMLFQIYEWLMSARCHSYFDAVGCSLGYKWISFFVTNTIQPICILSEYYFQLDCGFWACRNIEQVLWDIRGTGQPQGIQNTEAEKIVSSLYSHSSIKYFKLHWIDPGQMRHL